MKKWIAWVLVLCMLQTLTACGGQKNAETLAEVPVTEAPAAEALPQETEVKFVSDGITLAQIALQEIEKADSWYIDTKMEGKGRLGIGAGEHSAELIWQTATTYAGDNWSDMNYYFLNVGSKYAHVFEEFKILEGRHYYKNMDNAAWMVGSGIIPLPKSGVPVKQLLEKIVAGQLEADYAASAEEGHSLSLLLGGSDLMQLMKECFPGLVGADGIPETADWDSIQADITLHVNSYNRCPGKLVMNCPKILEMLAVSVSDASYLEFEEFEARVNVYYHNTDVYAEDELAMAVPGDIPQPASFGEMLRQTLNAAGTPLTPSRSEATVPAETQSVQQVDPIQKEEPVQTEPVQQDVPAETQKASGNFVIPEVFEPVKTREDITLYNMDGAYATVSYPTESAFYNNAEFNHGGTYYATIAHDVMSGIAGQTKLTLQDVQSVEDYLGGFADSFQKITSADDKLVSADIGDIQTITVNGMTVWYVEAAYESVNAFKKPVRMEYCYAVAAVNGSCLCVEFSYSYNPDNGSKRDFNPAELIFSHVK